MDTLSFTLLPRPYASTAVPSPPRLVRHKEAAREALPVVGHALAARRPRHPSEREKVALIRRVHEDARGVRDNARRGVSLDERLRVAKRNRGDCTPRAASR